MARRKPKGLTTDDRGRPRIKGLESGPMSKKSDRPTSHGRRSIYDYGTNVDKLKEQLRESARGGGSRKK